LASLRSAAYETSCVCPPKRLLNVQMFISKAKRKKRSGVGRTITWLCDAPKTRIAQLLAVRCWPLFIVFVGVWIV
jgi:hypothetical protein